MKNISVYLTNPSSKFYDKQVAPIIKIWIENSLRLGWSIEDIILVNNFPFEYAGIKSTVIDDSNYIPFRPGSSKTASIANLLWKGFFKEGELLWIHDPDCFQIEIITEEEIRNLLGNSDCGFTDYGTKSKWSMGSYFIKVNDNSRKIFHDIKETIYERQSKGLNAEDENALVQLTSENINDINQHIKRLNVTYNFGTRNLAKKYEVAEKPLRTLHFRPFKAGNLDTFMYSKNELNKILMTPELIKLFKYHRIK